MSDYAKLYSITTRITKTGRVSVITKRPGYPAGKVRYFQSELAAQQFVDDYIVGIRVFDATTRIELNGTQIDVFN